MSRRNIMAALGLLIVALLIAVTVYVGNLKAADAPPPPKTPAAPAAADQLKQLQTRIDLLEKRLATLEKGQIHYWDAPNSTPPIHVAPPLNWVPAPQAPGPEEKNDGFPKARIIFIDGKQPTNGNPAQ
jgi:hypothetical protein